MNTSWLREALGFDPFPWQLALLDRLLAGDDVRALDLPTGLGKTAVMAIWLVARASGAPLPRRLVYIVDRRVVVDQATEVAETLRAWVERSPDVKEALGLDGPLPISTLRGQFIDNREWLDDPSSPALVIGTVDMIGSRLLFEGYGTSRKMRPYAAGLLGVDTLFVLDEAHLVPPFEHLLADVADGAAALGPRASLDAAVVPPVRLLSLSATGRDHGSRTFSLTDADLAHAVVRQRLDAPKRVRTVQLDEGKLSAKLAEHAWRLGSGEAGPARVIVFANKREDAEAAKEAVEKLGAPPATTELLVGARRVFERSEATRRLAELGFVAGSTVERTQPTFVFATSAGEVGIDLDADHLVCDLVAWERMVQRLGRVNRRGLREADVVIVTEASPEPPKKVAAALAKDAQSRGKDELEAISRYHVEVGRADAQKRPLALLPELADGRVDASPRALVALKRRAVAEPDVADALVRASTRAPLRPGLSLPLLESWAMTSVREHTGRPDVQPWLRGWEEDPEPQTTVLWRRYLPVVEGRAMSEEQVLAFFEAAPPHATERLETETWRTRSWLQARCQKLVRSGVLPGEAVVAFALSSSGDHVEAFAAQALMDASERALRVLEGATLVVDLRLAGLRDGLLNETHDGAARALDDGEAWVDDEAAATRTVRFRVRPVEDTLESAKDDWTVRLALPVGIDPSGEVTSWLVVDKWRQDAATEDDRSAGPPQLLADHQSWAEARALRLGARLGLPTHLVELLGIAARLHDEGKRAARWQQAFRASADGVYAKTRGPVSQVRLGGYRHELGSLPYAQADRQLTALPDVDRELVLHLIAAHHGFARPVISMRGCDDAPPSVLVARTQEVALRYFDQQRRWGVWGLAWWEALLRAADQQASRANASQGGV